MTTTLNGEDSELSGIEKKINETMTRYKGFAGGVLFVVTAVWAFLSLVWSQLIEGKTGH